MARVKAFRALRPVPEKVAQVASVPYDVVNTEEARELARGNPLSFLHVSRSEIDLPEGTDPYSDGVYQQAKDAFARLAKEVPLITEDADSLYAYRQVMGSHSQVGVVGCVAVDDYDQDLVKKHEKTRKDKEDDRTRHTLAISCHSGPVFLTYRGEAKIDTMVKDAMAKTPLHDFKAPDGIQHTVWRFADPGKLVEAFAGVPVTYVADGHHRAKSASRTREELKGKNKAHTGNEEYNHFLAVLFPADQLRILPYNRVVKDLSGRTPEEFLSTLRGNFEVTEGTSPSPARQGQVSVYLKGKWYGLGLKVPGGTRRRVEILDVSLLQDQVLEPLLGIKDVRTDKRIDFVGGIRGTPELEKLVDSGKFAVAFSMFATTLDDLLSVSDAGDIMPPKSTWFEPKLRDGLLIHTF